MVAMLNHTAIRHSNSPSLPTSTSFFMNATSGGGAAAAATTDTDNCMDGVNGMALAEDGPFDWSEPLQGTILSCYFWGYFISQIPGARVAENFSAKWVMFFSVAINVVCTLLTPYMANLDYIAMILMRIGEGIGGGVTFPAMHVMLAAWAPPDERSIMSSIV